MRWVILVLSFCLPMVAQAERVSLPLKKWPKPPSGEALVKLEPLQKIIAAFDQETGSRIAIRYPGGDAGTAWAEEVRDWLVSLGVSSSRIALEPGSGKADTIILETLPPERRP